jgi:transmembrane sensor
MVKENIVRFPDAGAIEAEAAEWLVRLDGGTLSGEEYAKYQEWLARSPMHRDLFQRLSAVWDNLDTVKAYAEPLPRLDGGRYRDVAGRLAGGHRPWRKIAAAAASIFILAAAGFVYWDWPEPALEVVAYETPVGGQRTVALPDGSTVLLNTHSKVEVVYSRASRDVRLVRGEAYFEVAHDKKRSFTVANGNRLVRDLGTAFSVRQVGKALEVTVTKGTVELAVAAAAEKAQHLAVLNAGQSAAFDRKLAYVKRLSAVELNRQLSWRDGVLVYAGEPLADVAADISRYTNVKIELANPNLAKMPVGGYFEIGKLRTIFEALESNFGIHAEWIDETHVRLAASPRRAGRNRRENAGTTGD